MVFIYLNLIIDFLVFYEYFVRLGNIMLRQDIYIVLIFERRILCYRAWKIRNIYF